MNNFFNYLKLKRNTAVLLAASAVVIVLASCSAKAPISTTASQPVATIAPATATTEAAAPTSATSAPAATSAPQAAAQTTKFNLNTMTAEEILKVPNAGNRMVREFNEYRPYTSVAQFRQAIGKYVGDAQVDEYLKYVYVPVVPNDADKVTLQQLPGVDASIAGKLIAARPYADKAAFIKKLTELTSADQANSAAAYVEAL